jgi:hypothetical protein
VDPTTFRELVRRVRAGDADATGQFLDRYESAVRREIRFALLDDRLRRAFGTSDVVQSVLGRFFVGLYAGRYACDTPEQLRGLLKEMVRAKVVDWVRYHTAECRDHRREVALEAVGAALPMDQPTPSRIVAAADAAAAFEQRLTDAERILLDLRRQELGWKEIAARLDPSAGPEALRKRWERTVARILRELGLEE